VAPFYKIERGNGKGKNSSAHLTTVLTTNAVLDVARKHMEAQVEALYN
jgi:predicted RNA binding protein with dsRBD fold (UPF0201 family)